MSWSPIDLGTIYSQSGAGITTSYVAGTNQLPNGQPTRGTFWVSVTKASMGSTITTVNVKARVKNGTGTAGDIITTQNDANGTTLIDQSVTVPAAGNTAVTVLQTENLAPFGNGFDVMVKANAAGVSGDIVTITAVVM